MKTYKLWSDGHPVPLAEIRVDDRNNKFEVFSDNTNGKINAMAGDDFKALQQIITKSSHMRLEESNTQTIGLLRYLTSSGDVIEITTDSKTCFLNGKMLNEMEKQALMDAVRAKKITVSRKADISHPIPMVNPMVTIEPPNEEESPLDRFHTRATIRGMEEKDRLDKRNNFTRDRYIDGPDFPISDDPEKNELFINLMYAIRHGKKRK